MDDLWLFSDDQQLLLDLVGEIQSLLGQLGTELNSDKTKFFETSAPPTDFQLVDASAIEEERGSTPRKELTVLVDKILSDAQAAPRSNIGILYREMIFKGTFAQLAQIEPLIPHLNQGAGYIAVLLRKSSSWEKHEDWYRGYRKEHIVSSDWSVAAWAEMFPALQRPANVGDDFCSALGKTLQTSVVPLACQRIATWFRSEAIGVFGAAAPFLRSWFEIRGMAYASLEAGASNAEIGAWLSQSIGGETIHEFLTHTGFRKIPPTSRFVD
jgi:hypothetical protein